MAKLIVVKAARVSKRPRACCKCHKPIREGDSYKWFASRIGRSSIRKNFCATCPVRESDRTTSTQLQTLYLAVETAEDALDAISADPFTLDDVAQILRDAAEGVREASEGYTESADNMEDGFGHPTSMSDELREKAESVEGFATDLESAADEIDGMDDPAADDEKLREDWPDADLYDTADEAEDDPDAEDDEDEDPDDPVAEFEKWAEGERERRREEAMGRAQEALQELPL